MEGSLLGMELRSASVVSTEALMQTILIQKYGDKTIT